MNKEITQKDIDNYFNRDFVDVKDMFEYEYAKIQKKLHEDMSKLFKRFPNAKNFEVKFNYDWVVNCSGSIKENHNGWLDDISEKIKKKVIEENKSKFQKEIEEDNERLNEIYDNILGEFE
jgi:hypothetical protein